MGALEQWQVSQALSEQRRSIPQASSEDFEDLPPSVARHIPETLARRFNAIALRKEGDLLVVAMENPSDLAALDLMSHVTGSQLEPAQASSADITAAIERVYGHDIRTSEGLADQSLEEISLEIERDDMPGESEPAATELLASAEETPVVRFVEVLFREAVNKRASDVHIEPGEQTTNVRLRIDGVLQRLLSFSRRMQPAVVSRIKILSGLNIAERRLPQDGRCRLRFPDREVDVRVSTLPTVYGEKIVMRLLDKSRGLFDLEELGFGDFELERFREALNESYGMLLLSGPTGSGKTTTLYGALTFLNQPERNIITVEDPVEYELSGLSQVHINTNIGLTFAACLRSILRQDPNVIMVGEMRDLETTQIAIRAALTGHLVLSTLHANNSPAVVSRLMDIGIPPYLITASLRMACAQRLVRRLCDQCREPYVPPDEVLERLGYDIPPDAVLNRAIGCEKCVYTGYHGRVGLYEVMPINHKLKDMIVENRSEYDLRALAREQGMKTLYEQGMEKVFEGATTLEEILSIPTESGD